MKELANNSQVNNNLSVGVGLRHSHYDSALTTPPAVDFVEVHAENFYADGGLALSILMDIREIYDVSLHATSLGLGSIAPIDHRAILALKRLIDQVNPILVSDHACFTWTEKNSRIEHSGNLLPIVLNQVGMQRFIENVDRVQQVIGRKILIENLSSYFTLPGSTLSEFNFLQEVCLKTGSGILIDINNIHVSQVNNETVSPMESMMNIINELDADLIGEIHLAGCAMPLDGGLMIDDHSRPVHEIVWQVYRRAIEKFGKKPTLIEWDSKLPSWRTLISEAKKAQKISGAVK